MVPACWHAHAKIFQNDVLNENTNQRHGRCQTHRV